VTREAPDRKPLAADGEPGPDAQANGSGDPRPDDSVDSGDDEGTDGPLDLALDPLLDWGTDPRDAEKDLEAQTEEALLAAERDEYLDALRRLQADFDNFRKRSMRQQTELLERATEGLIVRLLPVLDALDLATAHVGCEDESNEAAKALEQIGALLRDILAREGVERIDAVGAPFDPTIHDAVGSRPAEPSPDGQAAGEPSPGGQTVAEVMRAGYRLKSKVLRPAMVIVGG